MQRFISLLAVSAFICFPSFSSAISIQFDRDMYAIRPGDSFAVHVLIDPVPEPGLFSLGLRVLYDDNEVQLHSMDDIILPAALNSDGFGGDPWKEIDQEVNGLFYGGVAAGVVQWEGYRDPLLATFQFTDKTSPSSTPYSYNLQLDLFLEGLSNFVDFNGEELDGRITSLGSAAVYVEPAQHIIPEPATAIGLLILFGSTAVSKIPCFRRTRDSRVSLVL